MSMKRRLVTPMPSKIAKLNFCNPCLVMKFSRNLSISKDNLIVRNIMTINKLFAVSILALSTTSVLAAQSVSVDNYVRAKSDNMLHSQLQLIGEIGDLYHYRAPLSIDKQPVIRMNQDTLYSAVILDLSKPATVTLPDGGDRYISMQVINQDHYAYAETKPGVYSFTQEQIGSRYVTIAFRTLIDANNPADVKKANELQDQIIVDTPIHGGELELPEWNQEDIKQATHLLNELSIMGMSETETFGLKDEVDPVHHLLGTASGWGGLPVQNASYIINDVADTSGTPHSLTVKDVPVNAFWSITIYNKDGFLEENSLGINSFNNLTADKNEDGSITMNFGGCENQTLNCIPVTEGWNYAVRLYEPKAEIISGEWIFPTPSIVN